MCDGLETGEEHNINSRFFPLFNTAHLAVATRVAIPLVDLTDC